MYIAHKAPADYTVYQIHSRTKKRLLSESTRHLLLSTTTLTRLIIFHQLKGAIIFQPPSYANESTHECKRNGYQMVLAGDILCRIEAVLSY